MRDRLIELISQVQYMVGLEGKLADHLLAEGMIALPKKFWILFNAQGFYGVGEYEVEKILVDPDGQIIKMLGKNLHHSCVAQYTDFGRTVFFSKEEAEKALAERNGSV